MRLITNVAATTILIAAISLILFTSTATAKVGSGGIALQPKQPVVSGSKARLVRKKYAVPPRNAPLAVKRMIRAGNQITNRPYKWGGGHGKLRDSGYDCSGAVSYLLRRAGIINRAYTSGSFARLGRKGKGRWVTVYANSGHVFMYVAGLRWDTAYRTDGDSSGPGWSRSHRPRSGYAVRHFKIG